MENVRQWILNDEGLYNHAKDCIMRTFNKKDAARLMKSELNHMGITKTPDGLSNFSYTSILNAMYSI